MGAQPGRAQHRLMEGRDCSCRMAPKTAAVVLPAKANRPAPTPRSVDWRFLVDLRSGLNGTGTRVSRGSSPAQ